jgi:hypothetical protein
LSDPACCKTNRWPYNENYFTLQGEREAGILALEDRSSSEIPVGCNSQNSAWMHSDNSRPWVIIEDVLLNDIFFKILTYKMEICTCH